MSEDASEILVPVAGLPQGRATLEYARMLAELLGLSVAVLSVAWRTGAEERARETAEAALALMGEVPGRAVVRVGDPAAQILGEAREARYRLMVLGPRDRPGLREAILGTVAQRLVDRTPLPTVVVSGEGKKPARILVATGGRRRAQAAIRAGASLAAAAGASVSVLYVTPPAPGMYYGLRPMEERLEDFLRQDTREARHLQWAVGYLEEQGVTVELLLRHGVVENEIVAELERGGQDLLVLGRVTSRFPLPRLLLGNLAPEVVVRSPVPVLVVPAGWEDAGLNRPPPAGRLAG